MPAGGGAGKPKGEKKEKKKKKGGGDAPAAGGAKAVRCNAAMPLRVPLFPLASTDTVAVPASCLCACQQCDRSIRTLSWNLNRKG
jgi:hypothetical protein